jgi:hypothetical protein
MRSERAHRLGSWLEGMEHEWLQIQSTFGAILTAGQEGDDATMRVHQRRLFRVVRRALKKARFKGRILGVLGTITRNADQKLAILKRSYAVSVKEGDSYSRLLVSHSLAEFFLGERCDTNQAYRWVERARPLLCQFKCSGLGKDFARLALTIAKVEKTAETKRAGQKRRVRLRNGSPRRRSF